MIDVFLFSFLVFMVLGAVSTHVSRPTANWIVNGTGSLRHFVISALSYAAGSVGSALCISHYGSSPGKWLFGIKVLGKDGDLLPRGPAFAREARLYWWGLGFGLSVWFFPLAIVMMLRSFIELKRTRRTCWDSKVGATVHARVPDRKLCVMLIVGFALVIAIKWGEFYSSFLEHRSG